MSPPARVVPPARIGYVGLGIMGLPMASNLLDAGYELIVCNRTPAKADPLIGRGATLAESPADLASHRPEVICINVTDTPDVEAVIFGEGGIAEAASEGLIILDHSTISPVATRDFAARLAQRGVTLIDAPVSGGDSGAKAGTLSIMVGGPDEVVERVRPLLEVVGERVTRVGEVGSGQACKACNQVAVFGALLGACEAIALARRLGLDVHRMIEVVAAGAGGSWQLANLGPRIAAGDLEPGFTIELALKDLGIVGDTARTLRLPLLGTSVAEAMLRAAAVEEGGEGGEQRGTQAMSRAVERLAGSVSP